MKGGVYGLGVMRISLILAGLLCVGLVTISWTNTTLLASINSPESTVLHLISEIPISDHKGHDAEVSENIHNTKRSENVLAELGSALSSGTYSNDSSAPGDHGASSVKVNSEIPASDPKGPHAEASKNTSMKEEIPDSDPKGLHAEASENTKSMKEGDNGLAAPVIASLPVTYSNDSSAPGDRRTAEINSGCSLAKGRWVIDDSRPLYSGHGCKQWLSSMWACRLTQRTDFEYEKLRWQPKDCEMEEFTGHKFLKRMENKTLAFVGDSLGRQQFQSMMCMITGGRERPDVLDVGKEYGLVKARGAVRPDGWAYRFPETNTTVLYYWSATLCDLEPLDLTNPTTDIAMHLDRPPSFLSRFLHKFDVLVLNSGHHWNRGKIKANRWVMHVGGHPNRNRKIADIAGAKNFTIYSTIAWVNSQLPTHPGLKAFYRSISPRHFFNGDWNTGGTCDNTSPLSSGNEVDQEESSDLLAAGAVKGTGVKLLDITAVSQLRDEGHISRYSIKATPGMQDCLHWCLPGVPDTWNEILFAQL